MPKSIQAKDHLHDLWQVDRKAKSNAAFDFFVETCGVKWDKAIAKLVKDRDLSSPDEYWRYFTAAGYVAV